MEHTENGVAGQCVAAKRNHLGWTQGKLARLSGYGQSLLSKHERGAVDLTVGRLIFLLRVMGVKRLEVDVDASEMWLDGLRLELADYEFPRRRFAEPSRLQGVELQKN